MSNRRQFIAATASGAALAGMGATAFAAVTPRAPRSLGGTPRMAAFQSLLGQTFKVRTGSGQAGSLHLQAVKPTAASPRTEQFTLVLRADGSQHSIDAGVYRLEHARAGGFDLYLEPSGSNAEGRLYRADMNLLA